MKEKMLTVQELLINDKWCIRNILVRLYVEYFNYRKHETNTAVFTASFVPCESPSPFQPFSKARRNIEMFNFNEVKKYTWDDKKAILTIFVNESSEAQIESFCNPIEVKKY